MKLGGVAFGVVLTTIAPIALAAVTQSQFPPRTVRDLIQVCAPAKDDPMMTAAINYWFLSAFGDRLAEITTSGG